MDQRSEQPKLIPVSFSMDHAVPRSIATPPGRGASPSQAYHQQYVAG